MERMAAQNPTNRQYGTPKRPVYFNGIYCILGTSWNKSTAGREQRRNSQLIKPDHSDKKVLKGHYRCFRSKSILPPRLTETTSLSANIIFWLKRQGKLGGIETKEEIESWYFMPKINDPLLFCRLAFGRLTALSQRDCPRQNRFVRQKRYPTPAPWRSGSTWKTREWSF